MPSSTQRGYGTVHRRLREQLVRTMDGTPCARCGIPLRTGDDVHLDHREDRSGWIGLSHALCNLQAGAAKANRMRLEDTLPPVPAPRHIVWSRDWYGDGRPAHVRMSHERA